MASIQDRTLSVVRGPGSEPGAAETLDVPGLAAAGDFCDPIRRTTLAGQIADLVRDLVLEGTLQPGSRIVEGELGRRLGVSRTPLREALKLLAGEGLIDFVPARGAVVHRITREQALNLLEVVTGLEAIAAPLACQRASLVEIEDVRRLHLRMEHHYEHGERLEYYKLNLAVHSAIVALSHNPELVDLHARHSARLKLIRFSGPSQPDHWHRAIEEHRSMITALEARDHARLAAILAGHHRLIWERVGAHVYDREVSNPNPPRERNVVTTRTRTTGGPY